MTAFSTINVFTTWCSQALYLPAPCLGEATNVPRFSLPILVGHKLMLWRQKARHMIHCPSCSNVRVSLLSWLWTALRNRLLLSYARNVETPAAKRKPLNLTPFGRMTLSKRSRSSRKELAGTSSSWQILPTDSQMTVWNKMLANMAHNIFKLDGELPKTVMSGETADISQFC